MSPAKKKASKPPKKTTKTSGKVKKYGRYDKLQG
jgi:hypothetical protein